MKKIKFLPIIILLFFLIFSIFSSSENIKEKVDDKNEGYKTIITIWHTDTFQGGAGSRKKFLSDITKSFEKKRKGVLFIVLEKTPQEVNQLLSEEKYPDILSFGNGININVTNEIKSNKDFPGCLVNGKIKALPWATGRYFLLENKKINKKTNINELLISKSNYNQPLLALNYSDINNKNFIVKDSDKAFLNFANGKYKYFLGTQRDIVKANNLSLEYSSIPLDNFNDLNQYISITTFSEQKVVIANEFIEYLLSEEVQIKLSNLCLYSPYYKVESKIEFLNIEMISSSTKRMKYLINEEESEDIFSISEKIIKNTEEKNKIENMGYLY